MANSKDTVKLRRFNFSTPSAIFQVDGLNIYEQMIYMVLCSFANQDSIAFPSYKTLAERGRMSRRKAIDSVNSLVQKGLLSKSARYNKAAENTSNEYIIEDAYEFLTENRDKKEENEHSAQHAPPLVHSMHHPSAQHAPKYNHLTLPNLIMNECMNDNSILDNSNEVDNSVNSIYSTLKEYIPKYCFVGNNIPMSSDYIDDIYLMLINQFKMQLGNEIIVTACEIYFKEACEIVVPHGVTMKRQLSNPIGFFQTCYKKAIQMYNAKINTPYRKAAELALSTGKLT